MQGNEAEDKDEPVCDSLTEELRHYKSINWSNFTGNKVTSLQVSVRSRHKRTKEEPK